MGGLFPQNERHSVPYDPAHLKPHDDVYPVHTHQMPDETANKVGGLAIGAAAVLLAFSVAHLHGVFDKDTKTTPDPVTDEISEVRSSFIGVVHAATSDDIPRSPVARLENDAKVYQFRPLEPVVADEKKSDETVVVAQAPQVVPPPIPVFRPMGLTP